MKKGTPLTQDEIADIRHFLPGLAAGTDSTNTIARKTSANSSSVWLLARKEGYRYVRTDEDAKGRWIGPDTTPQENGTMTQQAVEDWALSATDYEALLTTQAHEPEPQVANGHIVETDAAPEDEMVLALEEARAAVDDAARTIVELRTANADLQVDWQTEVFTLRVALETVRAEADTYKQDALRWRDRHYQDTLHKRQMSVGLLRKGTDELRKLLSGVPNDAA
jgi:hypothetical protein